MLSRENAAGWTLACLPEGSGGGNKQPPTDDFVSGFLPPFFECSKGMIGKESGLQGRGAPKGSKFFPFHLTGQNWEKHEGF